MGWRQPPDHHRHDQYPPRPHGGNDDQRRRLYDIPDLDFITNHAYHGDEDDKTTKEQEYKASSRENDNDLVTKLSRPKPVLIEEAGFEYVGDRKDRSEWVGDEMNKLLGEQGAAGYMPWGFMSGGNNGDGDEKCGMDRRFHGNDWDGLKKILSRLGQCSGRPGDAGRAADRRPLRRPPGVHPGERQSAQGTQLAGRDRHASARQHPV